MGVFDRSWMALLKAGGMSHGWARKLTTRLAVSGRVAGTRPASRGGGGQQRTRRQTITDSDSGSHEGDNGDNGEGEEQRHAVVPTDVNGAKTQAV